MLQSYIFRAYFLMWLTVVLLDKLTVFLMWLTAFLIPLTFKGCIVSFLQTICMRSV